MKQTLIALVLTWILPFSVSYAADWYHNPRPSYVESCLQKNTGTDDRYRLCERFFQDNFSKSDFPDDALFLRQRLIDLIPSYESAAWRAFNWYEITTYAIILCGFGALIAGAVFGASANRNILFSATGAALLAFLTAFGFHAQFKANFSAYRELTTLRDQIEFKLVQSGRAGKPLDKADLDAAFGQYAKIVNDHAKAFGASFSTPSMLGGG